MNLAFWHAAQVIQYCYFATQMSSWEAPKVTSTKSDKVFTLGFLGHFSHSQLRAQPLKLFEVGEARDDGLGHSACTWPQISLQSFRAKPKPGRGLERRYRKLNTLK